MNSLCRGYTLVVGRGNDRAWIYVHSSGPLPGAGMPVWVTGIVRREEDFYPHSGSITSSTTSSTPADPDTLPDLAFQVDVVPSTVIDADTPEMKVLYAAVDVLSVPAKFWAGIVFGPMPRSRRTSVHNSFPSRRRH
jgi:hypothetical protein